MANTTIRTMKLKISVFNEDKNETWKRIRQISNEARKAANKIIQGQYINDILITTLQKRFETNNEIKKIQNEYEKKIDVVKDDKIKKDLLEEEKNEKIKEIHLKNSERFKSVFGTFRQATTQKDAIDMFPNIPGSVINPLNNNVYNNYISDKEGVYFGKKSIRSYKENMPFPIRKSNITLTKESNNYIITWKINRNETAKFKIYLGKDKANYKSTIEKIINNEYKIGTPQLQLKDNKLTFHIPVNEPKKETSLDKKICVGVDLGIHITAYASLNNSTKRLSIGKGMNIVRFRTQFKKRKSAQQKDMVFIKGGKGRKRKRKCNAILTQKEHNTVKNINNIISKKIVEFALNNNAGIIKMEFLEGISENKKDNMILKNWAFYQLQEMIKYKAKRYNIKVVYIDPYLTSYTCSNCGNKINNERVEGERPKEYFKCSNCNEYIHADYNASLNIAKSNNVVTKKEQCMYNILENKEKHCKECEHNKNNIDSYEKCSLYINKQKECIFVSNDDYLNNKKQTIKERINKNKQKNINENSQSLG